MSRWLATLVVVALLAWPGRSAAALEDHDCFSTDNERRIAGCSALIEMSGIPRETRSEAYAMRALAYSLRGEYATAIRDYDQAIGLVPDFAIALNNRAWAYFKWGRPTQGLPDVERSLRLDPFSPHAYDTRAHIKQWLGDPAAALKDYEAAIRFGGTRMIKLYQCGLQAARLYKGDTDGIYTAELRRALVACIQGKECDPLPADEECRIATS